MAEVQTNDHNEGGKNKQKKQTLRVDFTPMVDMNMLLITFFMFCTTLMKPQTMNLTMPADDKEDIDTGTKARQSTAVTILIGDNDELYYYEGLPPEDYKDPNFLKKTSYEPDGLRALLLKKNAGTYEQIQELKILKQDEKITQEEYSQKVKEIQERAMKELKIAPTIIIKPTNLSTYANVVSVLDEMLICNIGAYAIVDLAPGDNYLLYSTTNNPEYLTDEQKAEVTK